MRNRHARRAYKHQTAPRITDELEHKNMKLLNDIRDALRTVKEIRQAQVRELELKDAERHKTLLEENAKLKSEVKRAWLAYTKTHASIAKNVTDAGQFRAIITDSVADTEASNVCMSKGADKR